jgi:hypothetical protein
MKEHGCKTWFSSIRNGWFNLILAILFRPFGLLAPKAFNLFAFSIVLFLAYLMNFLFQRDKSYYMYCHSVYHTHGEQMSYVITILYLTLNVSIYHHWCEAACRVLITVIDKMIKSYHDIYKYLFTMTMHFILMFCGLKAHFVLISIIKNSLYKNNGTGQFCHCDKLSIYIFWYIYKHILQIIESVYADKILAMVIFS